MNYVVDASIVVNYLLNTNPKLASKIATLFANSEYKLFSHILLSYEIANALRYSRSTRYLAQTALNEYFNLPIDILGLNGNIFNTAMSMSEDFEDTVYDASYHALALAHEMTFITCDRKYFDRAKQLGSIKLLA